MADVITRSIPAIPFQGGTLKTAQPFSAAVQLTPTRMIWTYCQTNPSWRYFVIVDTPEGWQNGGNPVVTVSRLQDQKTYRGISLQMVRLNDNAFMVMDLQSNSANNAQWSYEVFEIDSNNVFTRTATNLDAYDNLQTVSFNSNTGIMSANQSLPANAKFNNTSTFVPLADNSFLWAGFNTTSSVSISAVISYNTANKTISFLPSTAFNYSGFANAGTSNSAEVCWRAIPGSTKKAITFKTMDKLTNWGWSSSAGVSLMTVIVNADGSFNSCFSNNGSNLGTTGTTTHQDMVAMSEVRAARTSWNWIYYHGTVNSNVSGSGTYTNDGYGSYVANPQSQPQIALAMDANYLMLMDRTHFISSTSGNLKMKIVRRDDSNMVSQSAGSAVSVTGMDVTAPYIETWRADPRPRMMTNGDVFWWGLDMSGNLAWNVLKNAQ